MTKVAKMVYYLQQNKLICKKKEAVSKARQSLFFLQFHIKYSSKNFLFLQFICIFMTVYQTHKIWQNQYLSHTIKVK